MALERPFQEKQTQLKELAHGKIIAEEACGENGPGMDVDLTSMDDLAFEMAQAL